MDTPEFFGVASRHATLPSRQLQSNYMSEASNSIEVRDNLAYAPQDAAIFGCFSMAGQFEAR
jgi:hypothetical protein